MISQHRQVGERVVVLANVNTYDEFHNWENIGLVPNFQMNALPENGKEYQITFVEYLDDGTPYRMVLDNTFIVNEEAFKERPYTRPTWYYCGDDVGYDY